MTLLPRPLALHDVDDAERLCGSVIARSGLTLDYHDREDLLAYLLALTWELSERWEQPATARGWGFRAWATTTLRLRVIDWERQRFGRTKWQFASGVYERPRVELVSLNDPGDDRLGTALTVQAGNPSSDCDPTFGGLLEDGDSQRARDLDALGLSAPRRVA